MLDSLPVCASPNNTHDADQVSGNLVVAESRRITETFVVELDPGTVAESSPIPLNVGPTPSIFKEARQALPDHLQVFVDGHLTGVKFQSDSILRRQAMKARRLTRIIGDDWKVEFRPGAFCDDGEHEKAESHGHQFSAWADWIMEQEFWADDRAESGTMEDQLADQMQEFADRIGVVAKKLREAGAQAEFIRGQMEARRNASDKQNDDDDGSHDVFQDLFDEVLATPSEGEAAPPNDIEPGIPVYIYNKADGSYVRTSYLPDIRVSYLKSMNAPAINFSHRLFRFTTKVPCRSCWLTSSVATTI